MKTLTILTPESSKNLVVFFFFFSCPARSAGFLNPLTRKIVFVRPASVRACVRVYPISLL